MPSEKEKFVRELARVSSLSDNTLAKVFVHNPTIKISNKADFFENIKDIFFRIKNGEIEIEWGELNEPQIEASAEIKDYRVKKMKFSGIKGYPDTEEPFTADFTANDEPKSFMILGSNGSGKSSLFEILEYAYCGEIGEVELRNYESDNTDRYKKYLENFSSGRSNMFCEISTLEGKFGLDPSINIPESLKEKVNPSSHFISDYDLYSKGKLDFQKEDAGSFHYEIAKNLGFSSILEFETNLKKFVSYSKRRYTETKRIGECEEEITNIKELIENSRSSLNKKGEHLKELESYPSEDADEKKSEGELNEILKKLENEQLIIKYDSDFLASSIKDFKTYFKEFSVSEKNQFLINEVEFLRKGVDQLSNFDDCPFCLNSKDDRSKILENVKERILRIEESQKLDSKLDKYFHKTLDEILRVTNSINSFILEEKSKVKETIKKPLLSELFLKFNELEDKISNVMDSELLRDFSSLQSNKEYQKNQKKYLYNLILEHEDLSTKFEKLIELIEGYKSEKRQLLEAIPKLDSVPKDQTIIERKAVLTSEIKTLQLQIEKASTKLESLEDQLIVLKKTKSDFDEVASEAEKYQKAVSHKINDEVGDYFEIIEKTVVEILTKYLNKQERDVELVIKKELGEKDEDTQDILSEIMVAYVRRKSNGEKIEVSKYLNTFHYRLFLTMVSVSIAIASREISNANLPLVLDDVFYASDFENRSTIEHFLASLFTSYWRYSDLDLQLIIFTHDEVMFDSANRVISELENLTGEDFKFSRLIPERKTVIKNDERNVLFTFKKNYVDELIEMEMQLA